MTVRRPRRGSDRGQLVLVAAAALAIALFPLVLAYLQLGYMGDIDAEPAGADPERELHRALERAVDDAAGEIDARAVEQASGDGSAESRGIDGPEAAASTFRVGMSDELERVERSRLADGTAARVGYAPATAEAWIDEGRWREGVAGEFPEPTAHGGVIVQERAGQPTIIAVAFDIHLRTPEATVDRRLVVRVSE